MSAHREALGKNTRHDGDPLVDITICAYMNLAIEFGYLFKIVIANDSCYLFLEVLFILRWILHR